MSNKTIVGLTLRMPRPNKEPQDNPQILLRPDHRVTFKTIPGDAVGLQRAHLSLAKDSKPDNTEGCPVFLWGAYGVTFRLTQDLVLEQHANDFEIGSHNTTFEILALHNPVFGQLELDYGIGLAIKHLLEDLVKFEYHTED